MKRPKNFLSILIVIAILVLPFTPLEICLFYAFSLPVESLTGFTVLAQNGAATPDGMGVLMGVLDNIINALWKIFVALVVIVFLYAGFMFLTAGGNPDKIGKAKSAAIWGIVGVIVGILSFVVAEIIIDVLDLPE